MEINKEQVKAAVSEALFEAGLSNDMISVFKASKILSRRLVENGIKSGKLRIISAGGKKPKQMITMSDIVEYRKELLERGKLKK